MYLYIRSIRATFMKTRHFIWLKIGYFYVNKRKLRHFEVYHLSFYIKISTKLLLPSSFALVSNYSFSLPEIYIKYECNVTNPRKSNNHHHKGSVVHIQWRIQGVVKGAHASRGSKALTVKTACFWLFFLSNFIIQHPVALWKHGILYTPVISNRK